MDNQQRFIVGVSSGGRPIETASDHGFVVDYSELVIDILEIAMAMGGLGVAEVE